MISSAPIWAIVLRYMYAWQRDINLVLAGFYWPLQDILLWGFLGSWAQQSNTAQFHNYEVVALLGILLWQAVNRGSIIMSNSFHEELWSHNLVNLFSLPLRTMEWMCGMVLFTAIMVLVTSIYCLLIMFALYDIVMWDFICTFLIFLPPLFFSGIWIGFTCLQLIVILGKCATELGFVLGWCLAPFSGAFFPVEVLPWWGKMISYCLPMSYVFQGMREYVMYQSSPMLYLIKGYTLSIVYAIGAIILFMYFFNRTKQRGLARLAE